MRKKTARKPSPAHYCRGARRLGARAAKVISAASVVTGAWVRLKCRFGCDGYGGCLTCPPYSPTPEQTAALLKCYRRAVLVHGAEHADVSDIAVRLEREAFLDGYYKAFAMGAGPCRLCRECDLESKTCRHAERARPAMEAAGIDVFQTARNNGFPIEVVRARSCPQNYYGLVLLE